MRDNNIISILDVLLTETTLVTKANPGSVRIWDRYRLGPRFVRMVESGFQSSPCSFMSEHMLVYIYEALIQFE